jgi:catechol 2,3-dioxygenase-like lactoylglutathione lyase family enzyme
MRTSDCVLSEHRAVCWQNFGKIGAQIRNQRFLIHYAHFAGGRAMQLNHLHIKTTDVPKSRAFYERYFGFRLERESESGAIFMLDDANLLLTLVPYKDNDPRMPDWFHLGFCQGETQIVRDIYAKMKADGVKFSGEFNDMGEDGVAFYAIDPGGNKVEVSCYIEDAHLYKTPAKAASK